MTTSLGFFIFQDSCSIPTYWDTETRPSLFQASRNQSSSEFLLFQVLARVVSPMFWESAPSQWILASILRIILADRWLWPENSSLVLLKLSTSLQSTTFFPFLSSLLHRVRPARQPLIFHHGHPLNKLLLQPMPYWHLVLWRTQTKQGLDICCLI